MSNRLNQYSISLSIKGIQKRNNPEALELISNEIAMRTHLRSDSIVGNDKGEFYEVAIHLSCWGLNQDSAAKQAAEELFEIACAVLDDPGGVSVHINNTDGDKL